MFATYDSQIEPTTSCTLLAEEFRSGSWLSGSAFRRKDKVDVDEVDGTVFGALSIVAGTSAMFE